MQAEAYAALNADSTASGTDTVIIFTGIDEYYQKLELKTGTPTPDDIISAVNESLSIAYTAGARKYAPVLILMLFLSAQQGDLSCPASWLSAGVSHC